MRNHRPARLATLARFAFPALCAAGMLAMNANVSPAATAAPAAETKEERDARMKWWRDARFGMFIHWGLYSNAAGQWKGKEVPGAGEWLLYSGKVDPVEYRAALQPIFNPVKFNADEWARTAKDAGMQYVVITSKHHEGFCLWDSALTDYDVMNTPFKRDIMKELSEAVRAQGLHMGWYHSIMDWTHPDYLPRREWDKRPADKTSFPRYVQYMHGQLKELLTKYGKIDVLWFDGEWEDTWNHDWGKATDDLVRQLQPQIIVNNRVDTGRAGMEGFSSGEAQRGDYGTPEQTIPPNGMPGRDWETCMTMNDTWGFKTSDTHWKSSRELIRMLCDIASKGGNFLLNVGPRGDGTIPPESVERLHAMGEWLRVNGSAIYGTQASPFPRPLPWGRATQRAQGADTVLNLMVFDWPADGVLRLPGLGNEVRSATLLTAPGQPAAPSIRATRTAEGVQLGVPTAAPAGEVPVIQLVLAGAVNVAPQYITPAADGAVTCSAKDAVVTGSIQYEARYDNLGWWRDTVSAATWQVRVPTAGAYQVSLTYACNASCGGQAQVQVGSTTLPITLPPRTDWGDFGTVVAGTATLPANTPVSITVNALTKPGEAFINLRSVVLTPLR